VLWIDVLDTRAIVQRLDALSRPVQQPNGEDGAEFSGLAVTVFVYSELNYNPTGKPVSGEFHVQFIQQRPD